MFVACPRLFEYDLADIFSIRVEITVRRFFTHDWSLPWLTHRSRSKSYLLGIWNTTPCVVPVVAVRWFSPVVDWSAASQSRPWGSWTLMHLDAVRCPCPSCFGSFCSRPWPIIFYHVELDHSAFFIFCRVCVCHRLTKKSTRKLRLWSRPGTRRYDICVSLKGGQSRVRYRWEIRTQGAFRYRACDDVDVMFEKLPRIFPLEKHFQEEKQLMQLQ